MSPADVTEWVKLWFTPFLFIVLGTGAAVYAVFLVVYSLAKRRFRRLGASREEATQLIDIRGMERWRKRHPLLSLATNRWYQYQQDGVAKVGTPVEATVREAFEIRMEALQERLGSLWLLLSLSIAHDVRVVVEDDDDVEAAERYVALFEETLPHIENLRDFVLLTMEVGLVPACGATRDRIPVEYARALYPAAPTFAAPLTKEAYLRGEYEAHNVFDFEKVAA